MAAKHTYEFKFTSNGAMDVKEPVLYLGGDELWVGGRERGIVGIIDNLRTLRRIHKRLGEIIRKRGVFTGD